MKHKSILILVMLCLFYQTQAFATNENILTVYGKVAAGELDNEVMRERYPAISWERKESGNYENVTELAQALINGTAADIYAFNYAYGNFSNVVRKGYASSLDDSVGLVNVVRQMHPFIQEAVILNDKLYALPISLSCSHWAYSHIAFDMIGFGENDVPDDYSSLLAFIEWWVEEGSYDYPNVELFRGTQDVRRTIIERLVQDLVDYCWYSEQAMTFSVPELKILFEKLDNIDFKKETERLSSLAEGDVYQYPALFDISYDWFNIEQSEENKGYIPFPMPVMVNQMGIVPVDLRVFFVNSDSDNLNIALLYLDTYFQGMDELFHKLVMKDASGPLVNEYATAALQHGREEVTRIEILLTQASEDNRRQLEDDLTNAKILVDRLLLIQWRLTNEALTNYQSTIPYFYIRKNSPIGFLNAANESDINKLVDQYVQRHIGATAFLEKMDWLVKMVMKEAGE